MQRIFITFICIFATAVVYSQEYRHDISLSVGYIAIPRGFSEMNSDIRDAMGKEISLQYHYNHNKHWSFGSTAMVSFHWRDQIRLAITPTVKAFWFNTKYFGMYSIAGCGAVFTLTTPIYYDEPRCFFTYYLAPIAMEGGYKHVRVFLELSLGLKLGVRYSFGKPKPKNIPAEMSN